MVKITSLHRVCIELSNDHWMTSMIAFKAHSLAKRKTKNIYIVKISSFLDRLQYVILLSSFKILVPTTDVSAPLLSRNSKDSVVLD